MKHLFIINPMAKKIKGKTSEVIEEIDGFFQSYPQISYDIHVTRWCRDAVCVVRRYAESAGELVRVHVFGGSGTLFEAVNGVIGLPNAQIAARPLGKSNSLLRYFGQSKTHLFSSMRSMVFSDTIPIDAVRCGRNYTVCFSMAGLEAAANKKGDEWLAAFPPLRDLSYLGAAAHSAFSNNQYAGDYKLTADGVNYDGQYITILIANQPCYGRRMNPAVDAHPNDGILDLYLIKKHSKLSFAKTALIYTSGNYRRLPEIISHIKCEKVTLSSSAPMCLDMDGEIFFEDSIEFEIAPYAIDFVCPKGIDPDKLPLIYNRPEEGCVKC